jgi:hypothetical protein
VRDSIDYSPSNIETFGSVRNQLLHLLGCRSGTMEAGSGDVTGVHFVSTDADAFGIGVGVEFAKAP